LAKLLLSIEGYDVQTAVDADTAIKILETFYPKLILMDLQLPGKNGLDLTRELKADLKFKDIIIIALTAYAMKGDDNIAKAAGCDGYMTKPISAASFPFEITQYLKKGTANS
jgi:two-component system, cell cycle response regulator DivK